ncbi:MAG TPA: ABC transporter ATP-binding protein [Thiothrix sp.]|nr:ABC transporter ATP-binding protein [Thiothrix sp.]
MLTQNNSLTPDSSVLLTITNLHIQFQVEEGVLQAVRGVNLSLKAGETLAVVGESGAGKSQLFHVLMGLQANNAQVSGSVEFQGQELINQSAKQLNRLRGSAMSIVFQDPMTALNPYLRIGIQLIEVLEVHKKMANAEAKKTAIAMLEKVHINDAALRFNSYPHQLSGGMRQRVMIAMALLCQPQLLIADEPTTALDVTVQTDIIRLLHEIHETDKTSIILITHDLPLVAGLCEHIAIMYAGKIVEKGTVEEIHTQAKHPYTQALLAATPENISESGRLQTITGSPPNPLSLPTGCAFHPRCAYVEARCKREQPQDTMLSLTHTYACFKQDVSL